ncbi:hypothetical protein [Methanococcus voltae]|uniref:Uncharacterized protein n=1 Tax=Methanococcus voltae (strain ATCC BAA-1334 / A3) TaxID=456320 RepID=D7DTY1_METV3|nr:hypothetical protein [Methanococcus voltae]MCS3900391.1 hypothetical protein [Methanococcus voltae]
MSYSSKKLEDIQHSIIKEKDSIVRIRVLRVILGILILIMAYLLTNNLGIYAWLGAIFIIFILWAYISNKLSERCKMVEHLKNLELMQIEEKEDDLFRDEVDTEIIGEESTKITENNDHNVSNINIQNIEETADEEITNEAIMPKENENNENIDILNDKKD